MKKIFKFIAKIMVFLFLIIFASSKTFAITNPLESENNIFGIHIHDENDLDDAAKLVNSSGGDWGYITLVIRSDERDIQRWQNAMDRMRELHLVPIIRIATTQDGKGWTKPSSEDIKNWVDFLDSLNWVTKNRYIVIGNEPNHATEWGGSLDPKGYAEYLKDFSIMLKSKNEDFFVLPAGFDSSSPNNKTHMSIQTFLNNMITNVPDVFDHIDGWASHSYPNPDFSSSPEKTGLISITGYKNEIDILRSYGVKKDLPVFITETGWAHDTESGQDGLSVNKVKDYYLEGFHKWRSDPNIVAVTPFILNYTNEPFDKFSFKKPSGEFYDFYSNIQKLLKNKGKPQTVNTAKTVSKLTPEIIQKNDNLYSYAILKNTGQVIWEMEENYNIKVEGYDIEAEIGYPLFSRIDPGHIGILMYRKL